MIVIVCVIVIVIVIAIVQCAVGVCIHHTKPVAGVHRRRCTQRYCLCVYELQLGVLSRLQLPSHAAMQPHMLLCPQATCHSALPGSSSLDPDRGAHSSTAQH